MFTVLPPVLVHCRRGAALQTAESARPLVCRREAVYRPSYSHSTRATPVVTVRHLAAPSAPGASGRFMMHSCAPSSDPGLWRVRSWGALEGCLGVGVTGMR